MDVESAQVEIRQSSLETLIEKVHYGVCQRGFSEKLWVEKRTDILIFSGGVYDDSSGKNGRSAVQVPNSALFFSKVFEV